MHKGNFLFSYFISVIVFLVSLLHVLLYLSSSFSVTEPVEPPPKTYTTRPGFEYFKPCVQVEMENPDRLDTVTEVFVRGKADTDMAATS